MPLRERARQLLYGGRSTKSKDKANETAKLIENPLNPKATGTRKILHTDSADISGGVTEDSRIKKSKFKPESIDVTSSHSHLFTSSPTVLGPKTLWNEAYDILREKDSKLIDAYERLLLVSQHQHQQGKRETLVMEGIDREVQLQMLVDRKLQDLGKSRLKINISGKQVIVKDQVGKIVRAILSAKDFIGSAVCTEPHAAIAWAGVLVILPVFQNPITQDDDAMEGLTYISELLLRSKVIEDTCLKCSIQDQSTSQALRELNLSFKDKTVELYCQILKYQIQLAQQFSRSGLLRFLRDLVIADEWRVIVTDIMRTEEGIRKDLNTLGSSTLKAIDDRLSKLQNQADKSWALLIKTKADVEVIHQNQLLGSLPTAEYAAFDSVEDRDQPKCLVKTRTHILSKIQAWGEGHGDEYIFWLNGLAGTGKSTIARTVAETFARKRCLGASFFFSRGKGERGHAATFFTTLAVQLANVVPDLSPYICDAIKEQSSIGRQTLPNQWERLILRPLLLLDKSLLLSLVLVLVIDALDECDGDRDITEILQLFNGVKDLKSIQIRIFVTSRPETPIRHGFRKLPKSAYYDLMLHSVPQPVIEHDISIFLRHELAKIKEKHSLGEDWPGDEDIKILCQKANRLFIYAATACRFLSDSLYPEDRLSEMLQVGTKRHSSTKELDEIYILVLSHSITDGHDEDNEDMAKLFKQIVGSILILFESQSTASLTNLLAVSSAKMKGTLEPLHSVLIVPEDETSPVQLFHLSFRDFLLDKLRCSDPRFWVDERAAHDRLFLRCLKLMSEHLMRDICRLRLPGALASEVKKNDLDTHLPVCVQYACRYWVEHFRRGEINPHNYGEIHEFLEEHFLHWLEALSLMGKVSEAVLMMAALQSTLTPNIHVELHALVCDTRRFILNHRSLIEMAPLQVYHSALVFSPAKSITRKLFLNFDRTWAKSVPLVEDWGSFLQTLEGHSGSIHKLAFSPDSMLLASGSHDRTVRLWDPVTGATLQTLEGHVGSIHTLDFSPNGQILASAADDDDTIRLWDPMTGATLQILEGHSDSVCKLVFSPNGQILASTADNDYIIWLWDPMTGVILQTLEGHTGLIQSLAFSHDNTLLASGSSDRTVRLWDPMTGVALQTLEGHSDWVCTVAFSPDGQILASGSEDQTIRLWNSLAGMTLQTLEGHSDEVSTVAFSPDGRILASGSKDHTIRLWDPATGTILRTLEGYSGSISMVTFSPNGQLLTSGSYEYKSKPSELTDNVVRLWDPTTGVALQTLEGHSDWVCTVAFSPDGRILASGSEDKTIRLWDPWVGAASQMLEGHARPVCTVAFSPDNKLLASGSYDNIIRLWDPAIGATLQTLKGHSGSVFALDFSPNGRVLASGSTDHTVRIWDLAAGVTLQTLKGHLSTVLAVVFSPNGRILASGSYDYTIRLWDFATGAIVQKIQSYLGSVHALAFSPNGRHLASGLDDNIVHLWDPMTGVPLQTLGQSCLIDNVAFSPNGQVLASTSALDNTIRLWDPMMGATLQTLEGHAGSVDILAFSPDSQILASVADDDNMIWLWDPMTGATLQTLEGHTDSIQSLAFSHDSALLASRSYDRTVRVWDPVTGAILQTLEGYSCLYCTLVFSPTGRILAFGSDRAVWLWDIDSGIKLRVLQGHSSSVHSLIFSPDGQILASGSADHTVRLWDPITGATLQTLNDHLGSVRTLAFSPDGRIIASGSTGDHTVRLWDPSTGELLQTLEGHSGWVHKLAFSPDSRTLASGSRYDDTVRLWNPITGTALQVLDGHSAMVDVVEFCPDGRLLTNGSTVYTVQLWDTKTKESIQQCTTKYRPESLSFSAEGSSLELARGLIHFELPSLRPIQSPSRSLYSLDKTGNWVAWKTHNVLLLPFDRRAEVFTIKDNILAMGHASGRLTFLEFDPDLSPLESYGIDD